MILVSACLLNHPVRYKGDANPCPQLLEALAKGHGDQLLPFCPEVSGSLPTPRPPAEICGGSGVDVLQGKVLVVNKEGQDVTAAFIDGAQKCAELCQKKGITVAILKQRSPSCGSKAIYDGSFSGTTMAGQGVTTALLTSMGVKVYGEEDLTPELLETLL